MDPYNTCKYDIFLLYIWTCLKKFSLVKLMFLEKLLVTISGDSNRLWMQWFSEIITKLVKYSFTTMVVIMFTYVIEK